MLIPSCWRRKKQRITKRWWRLPRSSKMWGRIVTITSKQFWQRGCQRCIQVSRNLTIDVILRLLTNRNHHRIGKGSNASSLGSLIKSHLAAQQSMQMPERQSLQRVHFSTRVHKRLSRVTAEQ
jgi:hypothetical protein